MILGLQITGILFGIMMLYYSHLQFKRKAFSTQDFAIWSIIWTVFILTSIFPSYLSIITSALSLERRLDLLVISAILFVVALTFHNHIRLKRNQRKLERAIRGMALNEKKNN